MSEDLSREELRAVALKYPDVWWAVLAVDPLVMRVLPWTLRRAWATPNRITLVGCAFGVGAVASFLTGHLVLGAVLFEIRFFLDCLDGKVARVRGLASQRGALLDMATDVLLITSAMGALAWYLAPTVRGEAGPDVVPFVLSGLTTFFCFVLFWLIAWDMGHPTPGPPRVRSGAAGWMERHRLYRLPRTVEFETLLLFVAPLTGNEVVLHVAFALSLTYFVLASANLFARLYRSAAPAAEAGSAEQTPMTRVP